MSTGNKHDSGVAQGARRAMDQAPESPAGSGRWSAPRNNSSTTEVLRFADHRAAAGAVRGRHDEGPAFVPSSNSSIRCPNPMGLTLAVVFCMLTPFLSCLVARCVDLLTTACSVVGGPSASRLVKLCTKWN
jgi:hypothetical protein